MAKRSWNHQRSRLVVSLGGPHHGAVDPIVVPGQPVWIDAKFSYGAVSKDLQDEDVVLFRGGHTTGCSSWQAAGGGRTDRDGRLRVALESAPDTPGRHPFNLVVAADGSVATGAIWVVEPQQRVVVFDIDGTLTQGDEAIVEQVLSGASPEPRSGAAAVATQLAERGAMLIYITGRPSVLAGITRAWLSEHGFPDGPVRLTTTTGAAMPTDDGVQTFKLDTLRMLQTLGVEIERAYGNAVTDICAYAQAGVPAAVTFIAGSHGGEGCDGSAPTQALGDNYDAHLETLR